MKKISIFKKTGFLNLEELRQLIEDLVNVISRKVNERTVFT